MSLVFLIGMPGAGKTFWGRTWAAQHGWGFADLDEHVEQMAGFSIPQIFAASGEDGFRAIEAVVLEETIKGCARINTIIATGGGTPVYGDNIDIMRAAGCVVYLKARIKTLLRHLRDGEDQRPLLEDISEEGLEAVRDYRGFFYELAHQQIEVERIGEGTFAQILEACTNRPS